MKMQELNRPEPYRNRELLDAVLQKKEDHNKSETGSRISALISRQNGNLSRPSSFSRRSLSRQSLSESQDSSEVYDRVQPGIQKAIFSLGVLCISALVLMGLSLQILFVLDEDRNPSPGRGTLLNSTRNYKELIEVTTAMATLVLMLNICCLLVCSMQCFFAAKILKLSQGEERAFKYLHDCSSSQFIAVTGFFMSIPAFLVAIVLYIVMQFRSAPAMVATVILGVGLLFCVLSVMQNTYHWRLEKSRAEDGLSVYDRPKHMEVANPRNELSTLV